MDLSSIAKRLTALGYRVSVFATAKDAAAYLDREIDGTSVGIGGSVTVQEMGLAPLLRRHNRVVWHWECEEGKTAEEMLDAATATEVYLSSVGALAESGELVNIDGTGNRLAGTLYGHRRVYFLVGSNKIVKDEAAAVWRTRNIAAPKNAARLGRATPCAADGKCHNCKSPARICRALSILWAAPRGASYEVVLIDEPLGY